ncbi:MAG: DM13 domain-containing protein [Gemmatimonadales bacterium]
MRPPARILWAAVAMLAACSVTPPTAPDAEALPPTAPDGGGGTTGGGDGAGLDGASGRFVSLGGHRASGGVTLRMGDGGGEVIFAEDFSSTPVPDPHVYVATEPDANRGSRLRIATLQRSSGAQRYAFRLPEGTAYGYVLVWCDKFNVGVGAASLAPVASGNLP